MNRALARKIVACLRVSDPAEPRGDWLTGFPRREWQRTLEWLDHSGLALLFWNRAKALGAESAIPYEVGAQLDRSLAHHRLRVGAMLKEFDSINRCLEAAGLRYAALKGFALIPAYCPDIFLRTTYDYDYLLPQESMGRAEQVLQSIGYRRKPERDEHSAVYFHENRPLCTPLSRDDLYSAGFPRTVELHDGLWAPDELKIPLELPEAPLAFRRLRHIHRLQVDSGVRSELEPAVSFYSLCEEDELVFQILHAFRHILSNWCRLCSFLEIAYFVKDRSQDAAFWERFCERTRGCGAMRDMAGVVFALAERLFGAETPSAVAADTIQGLRTSLVLWVQAYGSDSALANFSDNKFSLFLHREFIKDEALWREVRRSRLFPLQRPSRAAEPSSPRLSSRLLAAWKQGIYTGRRLRHHLVAAARYGIESRRWERARARGARSAAL